MPDHRVPPSQTRSARRIQDHPRLGPLPHAPKVPFTFDGRPMVGRAGEPIAAALLASGIRVFRTMPRFGEARGAYCFLGRCSDCLMTVDGVTNVRTCLEPVRDGARVITQIGVGVWDPGNDPLPEEASASSST